MTQERQDTILEEFKKNLRELREGKRLRAHIGNLPEDVARTKKVPPEIFIDMKAVTKIENYHKVDIDGRFVENLNDSETLIFYNKRDKNEPTKINFIKNLPNRRFLIVATNQFSDKHFVVTGIETKYQNYVESVKKRGEVINIAGRTPFPSIASPPTQSEATRQLERFSGVGNITTSPKSNNNIAENFEKVKGLADEDKPAEKKLKKGGFTL